MFLLKEIDKLEWKHNFHLSENNNLLQCWEYGEAKKNSTKSDVVRFLISDDNGNSIGLVQFIVKMLPLIGGIARMNRGPILLSSYDQDQYELLSIQIIKAFKNEFKKRNWKLVFLAPELAKSINVFKSLKKLNLSKLSKPNYSSGRLDLNFGQDNLMMQFKKKWRYCLKKSLTSELNIRIADNNSKEFGLLITKYKELQNRNSFSGISESLILSMSEQTDSDWGFNLFVAEEGEFKEKKILGMLVMIRHGDTATYLIGLTDEKGRKLNANYALLWNAILYAKKINCKWFDIGGLDETTPQGIAHFKKGLNSSLYSLTGEWVYFKFPFSLLKYIFKIEK